MLQVFRHPMVQIHSMKLEITSLAYLSVNNINIGRRTQYAPSTRLMLIQFHTFFFAHFLFTQNVKTGSRYHTVHPRFNSQVGPRVFFPPCFPSTIQKGDFILECVEVLSCTFVPPARGRDTSDSHLNLISNLNVSSPVATFAR